MNACEPRRSATGDGVQTFGKYNAADFVQDLKDDLKAIRDADAAMDSDDQVGVASTAAVGRLIKTGMAEVFQLDAIMRSKHARNADKLRVWDSASHFEREQKPAPANLVK